MSGTAVVELVAVTAVHTDVRLMSAEPFCRPSGRVRTFENFKLTGPRSDAKGVIPASVILQELYDNAPAGHITLRWLTDSLHKQSFGFIMLVLATLAVAPGISILGGALLLFPAFQMMAGCSVPAFPRWIADRPLPTRHLGPVVRQVISLLKVLENMIHPRWTISPTVTKRIVGTIVMMLCIRLLLAPIPFSNIVPAVLIGSISLAYLEEDGVLLSLSIFAALLVLAVDFGLFWEVFEGAKRIRLLP
jgi:hypothetical protein